MYHNQTDIGTVQANFLQGVGESLVVFKGKVVFHCNLPESVSPAFALSMILICDDYASEFN